MVARYEIFRKLPEGPLWIESITGLDKIADCLKNLIETTPGDYFVYNLWEARIVAEFSFGANSDSNAKMRYAYKLCKQNENGEPILVETVFGLNQVKDRLMKLSSIKPATYLVYDLAEAKFIEPFKKSA